MKKMLIWGVGMMCAMILKAQPVTVYTTTESETWKKTKFSLQMSKNFIFFQHLHPYHYLV